MGVRKVSFKTAAKVKECGGTWEIDLRFSSRINNEKITEFVTKAFPSPSGKIIINEHEIMILPEKELDRVLHLVKEFNQYLRERKKIEDELVKSGLSLNSLVYAHFKS